MLSAVGWWRCLLCAVAALNVSVWSLSLVALKRARPDLSVEAYAARRLQVSLSGAYVLGCAFRCVFPVFDIPRLVLTDSWLSSVVVGRSVATVAELCFAGQWALMLHQAAVATRSPFARIASRSIVPMIGIAEACSWYAVLTTANIAHVAENSLWGLAAALVVISMVTVIVHWPAAQRLVFTAWCVAGAAYVAFIFLSDVPMYWSRWTADQASGHHYLTLAQGLLDVSTRWVVSYRWEDWRNEVAWMSLYFSGGVWASISLIYAPAPGVRDALEERNHVVSPLAQ